MRALPRLHAITDARILALPDLLDRAARLAETGGSALAIHVRDRALPARTLLARAEALRQVTRAAEASLVINGRADVARLAGAQGLQLGEADLSPAEARLVLGPAWQGFIGVSVHGAVEADRITGADFLLLGNIHPTASHPGRPGIGLAPLRRLAQGPRPVVAIGGIDPDRAAEVRAAGAWGIAAITSLWDAADPAAAAARLLAPWLEAA